MNIANDAQSPDLVLVALERWEDGPGYIFLELPDDQEELASYLKDREAEGVKSVHFYFPNDLDASTQTTNHMVVDVAGFSERSGNIYKPLRTGAVVGRAATLRS